MVRSAHPTAIKGRVRSAHRSVYFLFFSRLGNNTNSVPEM
jgi:hypothetical protein